MPLPVLLKPAPTIEVLTAEVHFARNNPGRRTRDQAVDFCRAEAARRGLAEFAPDGYPYPPGTQPGTRPDGTLVLTLSYLGEATVTAQAAIDLQAYMQDGRRVAGGVGPGIDYYSG